MNMFGMVIPPPRPPPFPKCPNPTLLTEASLGGAITLFLLPLAALGLDGPVVQQLPGPSPSPPDVLLQPPGRPVHRRRHPEPALDPLAGQHEPRRRAVPETQLLGQQLPQDAPLVHPVARVRGEREAEQRELRQEAPADHGSRRVPRRKGARVALRRQPLRRVGGQDGLDQVSPQTSQWFSILTKGSGRSRGRRATHRPDHGALDQGVLESQKLPT